MRTELLLLATEFSRRGEAFALATVVRRGGPTSSHVGDGALITSSGAFHGWLGGSCTEPVVVREALAALADGKSRLIGLSPNPEADRRPGIDIFPMTCHSGGTVEIYIDPLLPPARLVVFGISPVARALARMAKAMEFAVTAVDPDADRVAFPAADEVLTTLDVGQLRQRPGLHGPHVHAVVATMGQNDEDAITAALALSPFYVGVVSSRTRFTELRQILGERGVDARTLDAVKAPAGLDIGARRPEEIAVSILAEIVQRHEAIGQQQSVGHAAHAPAATGAATTGLPIAVELAASETAIDPVCGMTVKVANAKHVAEHDGRTYYFCAGGCKSRFMANPELYLAAAAGAK